MGFIKCVYALVSNGCVFERVLCVYMCAWGGIFVCVCVCFRVIMGMCECWIQVINAGTLEPGRQSDGHRAKVKRGKDGKRGWRRRLEQN